MSGAAAASQLVHNIVPATNHSPFHGETCVLPQGANLANDFDAHFDNLATAETHGNEIVQGMLDHLAWSATSQHIEVKKLLAAVKSALTSIGGQNNDGGGGTTGSTSGGGTITAHTTVTVKQKETLDRRIVQLQTPVNLKWIQGGFCSTHGHGVGYKQDSKSCSNKYMGHVDAATRENSAGPGTSKKKGWDK